MHEQPVAVPIDDEARQPVGLAKNQTAGVLCVERPIERLPQGDRRVEPRSPQFAVERLSLGPRVESDADLAGRVIQAGRDELAVGSVESDIAARRRFAVDAVDRAGKDPRVVAKERQGAPRLEANLGADFGSEARVDTRGDFSRKVRAND